LADRAIVLPRHGDPARTGVVDSRAGTLEAVRRALEAAGVEFLSLVEEIEGIRVRQARGDPRRERFG